MAKHAVRETMHAEHEENTGPRGEHNGGSRSFPDDCPLAKYSSIKDNVNVATQLFCCLLRRSISVSNLILFNKVLTIYDINSSQICYIMYT